MLKMFRIALLGALFLPAASHAQTATSAVAQTTCGALATPYTAGQLSRITVDLNGNLCTSGGGGGGSTVTANQGTGQTTSPWSVQGNVASGSTDSGNPVKVGGVFNTTLPTLSTGQRGDLQLDTRGNIRALVAGIAVARADGASNIVAQSANSASSSSGLPLQTYGTLYNGSTIDGQRSMQATDMAAGLGVLATGIVPTSNASQGLTTVSAAGVASQVAKASAGNVYSLNIVNNTTAGFAFVYDSATALTTGTAFTASLLRYCFPVAASSGIDKVWPVPLAMTNGTFEGISTSCTTYTVPANLPISMASQVK